MTAAKKNSKLSNVLPTARVGWVDIVKGMSIMLVVMMHSTLGVQNGLGETSWMGTLVEFARPFRIPCFMLVSGLFLHKTINGEWRQYIDRKVLHFVYFYVLWVAIQSIVKTPYWMNNGESGINIFHTYLTTFVQPFGTLWFIYMLPIFYLVTRLLRDVNWQLVLAGAIVLQILPIQTGSTLIDEFASRYVYFYIGFVFYQRIFDWAEVAKNKHLMHIALIALWSVVNYILTQTVNAAQLTAGSGLKLADLPLVSLALGIAGALIMIGVGAVISQIKILRIMQWIGKHSIVIYLAFFLPMAISRVVLLDIGNGYLSTGTIALLVTLIATIVPMLIYLLVKKTGLGLWLFERPEIAKLNFVSNKSRP